MDGSGWKKVNKWEEQMGWSKEEKTGWEVGEGTTLLIGYVCPSLPGTFMHKVPWWHEEYAIYFSP